MNWQKQNNDEKASDPVPLEQDYSFLSLCNMFAKVIIFSLKSFEDPKRPDETPRGRSWETPQEK